MSKKRTRLAGHRNRRTSTKAPRPGRETHTQPGDAPRHQAERSRWRDPGSMRGAIAAGVAGGLILLAGGDVAEHTDFEVRRCSITATTYNVTITTNWRPNC